MHAVHPDVAAKWDEEYPSLNNLPKYKKKKRKKNVS